MLYMKDVASRVLILISNCYLNTEFFSSPASRVLYLQTPRPSAIFLVMNGLERYSIFSSATLNDPKWALKKDIILKKKGTYS